MSLQKTYKWFLYWAYTLYHQLTYSILDRPSLVFTTTQWGCFISLIFTYVETEIQRSELECQIHMAKWQNQGLNERNLIKDSVPYTSLRFL